MIRYFDLNLKTDNNFCDSLCADYMAAIPDDGRPYGLMNGEIVCLLDTTEYKTKIAQEQEAKFNKEFIQTTFGCLRVQPKGFSNLMESFNTAMIACSGFGFVPEGSITIYQKPVFTGVQTQEEIEKLILTGMTKNQQLSSAQFIPMYLEVAQKWVSQEHGRNG